MSESVRNETVGQTLAEVAAHLAQANRVLFITGAGISADSGLPTYRGVGGLYNGDVTEEGLHIEEALSGDVFYVRPDITWKYLAQIEANCRGALPNPAHFAIARLEEVMERVTVFTQNVDGLHRAAGSSDVIEIHGSLHDLACTECAHEESIVDLAGREIPPLCPDCGAVLRPKVVLFGEALPEEKMERFLDGLEEGYDMVFSIGTSSVFPYIVEPVVWAASVGIPTVEINPVRTQLSGVVAYHLPLGAAEAMSRLLTGMGMPVSPKA